MRRAWILPVAVAVTTVALIASTHERSSHGAREDDGAGGAGRAASSGGHVVETEERLTELDTYVDPDFGFSLAVPAGWIPVVAEESDADLDVLEPGYAIGFESPRERDGDVFSDYLMVEIMPGRDSGLFETDGSRRRETVVDGRTAWRDELTIAPGSGHGGGTALLVRQAALSGLGYTVGLYAVGEPARRVLLEEAFEAMLRTFRLPHAPFDVS